MTEKPTTQTMQAWSKLIRVEQTLMNEIETRLKAAKLPSLKWYDVLLELSRTPDGYLRPKMLEDSLLLSQYNISRLIDRMAKAGLVSSKPLPGDKRAQVIQITEQGRKIKDNIWQIYGPFIQEHMGDKLSEAEIATLINLLKKLQ
ncbi:MarR family transcriptional regulator [Terasakiella sp. A23]|uniref:MarR family winged helix-turn-helix transcriptional regulator n=1 Tax=Terasakiella sp. FCG-A23 TaxID=3080561 RepID=UPI002953F606|nr:MarR family transcriptional regulator [Terasakiella sp. A23]MDV7338037.1 MarR family transcriptional regulator [Terasakiella sp. A23]